MPGVTPEQILAAENEISAVYAQTRQAVTPETREVLDHAFALGIVLHADQPRASKGDSRPYMIHVAGVVRLVLEQFGLKEQMTNPVEFTDALAAAWLHDTIEDGKKGRWGKVQIKALADNDEALRTETGNLIQTLTNVNVLANVKALSKPNYDGFGLTDEIQIEAQYYIDLGSAPLGTQLIKAADFSFNLGDLKNHPDRAFPKKFFVKRLGPVLGFLPGAKINAEAKAQLVRFIRGSVNENNDVNQRVNDPIKAPPTLTEDQEALLSQAEATYAVRSELRSTGKSEEPIAFEPIKLKLKKEGTRDVIGHGGLMWGEVPIDIKDASTLAEFNRLLKQARQREYDAKSDGTPKLLILTDPRERNFTIPGIVTGHATRIIDFSGAGIELFQRYWTGIIFVDRASVFFDRRHSIEFHADLLFDPKDVSLTVSAPSGRSEVRQIIEPVLDVVYQSINGMVAQIASENPKAAVTIKLQEIDRSFTDIWTGQPSKSVNVGSIAVRELKARPYGSRTTVTAAQHGTDIYIQTWLRSEARTIETKLKLVEPSNPRKLEVQAVGPFRYDYEWSEIPLDLTHQETRKVLENFLKLAGNVDISKFGNPRILVAKSNSSGVIYYTALALTEKTTSKLSLLILDLIGAANHPASKNFYQDYATGWSARDVLRSREGKFVQADVRAFPTAAMPELDNATRTLTIQHPDGRSELRRIEQTRPSFNGERVVADFNRIKDSDAKVKELIYTAQHMGETGRVIVYNVDRTDPLGRLLSDDSGLKKQLITESGGLAQASKKYLKGYQGEVVVLSDKASPIEAAELRSELRKVGINEDRTYVLADENGKAGTVGAGLKGIEFYRLNKQLPDFMAFDNQRGLFIITDLSVMASWRDLYERNVAFARAA